MVRHERFHRSATIRALRQLGFSDTDIKDELERVARYKTTTVVVTGPSPLLRPHALRKVPDDNVHNRW